MIESLRTFGYIENFRPKGLIHELPGDFTDGETPDPIPNSEAKLVQADGSPLG